MGASLLALAKSIYFNSQRKDTKNTQIKNYYRKSVITNYNCPT